MSLVRLQVLTIAAGTLGLSACAAPTPEAPVRTPVRWIMVEKAVGEIVPNGQNGDGQVDPGSMVLTLQPLYSEDVDWEVVVDPHDFFVEILEISPSRQARPGETVSARVRVGRAREGDIYRLTARASQSEVEIVGERVKTVRGSAAASFRFTSLSPGKGGIAIGVEKVEGRGP